MFIKYPRTPHLPWSPGKTDDDKVLHDLSNFNNKCVVITRKMDGENSTMYRDHIHARSIDSKGGVDRDWVKMFWSGIAHDIPEGWRICGENLWARHSIAYDNLPSFFMGFSIWDADNTCLEWNDTLHYFELLGIEPVHAIYTGIWDESMCKSLHKTLDLEKDEGFVVRLAGSFHYDDFGKSVAKYVRKGHVQTDTHWRHMQIVPNKLCEN